MAYPCVSINGIVVPDVYVAPPINCVPLKQTVWCFDFDKGNDQNDGLTPATALKTWTTRPDGSPGEYVSRTGFNSLIGTVDFYVKGNMPDTDMMAFFGVPAPNFQIRVHGTPIVKRRGTITAKQDRSPGGHAILSSTNTGPIIIEHDGATILNNWDEVVVYNHLVNTNANSENAALRTWSIVVIDPTHFSLTGSVGNGVGGATGQWSANQRDEITDSAVTDWSSDVNMLFEVQTLATRVYEGNVVSGPTRGWVAKALTAPVRAGMSIMASQNYSFTNKAQGEWPGPFPVGATYSILQLPQVTSLYIDARLTLGLVNRVMPSFLELLDFKVNLTPGHALGGFGSWFTYDSSADSFYSVNGNAFFVNCLARGALVFVGNVSSTFGLIRGPAIGFTGTWTAYGMMFQGPGAGIPWDGSGGNGNGAVIQNHHASFGLGIYDCDAPLYFGNNASMSNESSVYGTGITTSVVHIDQGGRAVDNNPYTVMRPYCVAKGAPSDIVLNNQPTMPPADPVPHALGGGVFVQSYAAAIPLTFANMFKTFANGGFEGRAFDPDSPQTSYEMEHP